MLIKTIGIIGYGNMGAAIAERIKTKCKVHIYEKDASKIVYLSEIIAADDMIELLHKSANILLAIKPHDFEPVLTRIKPYVKTKLIISIAAGIPISYIEEHLGNVRVIRVMPNLAAKVGRGISCLCKGKYAYVGDLASVREIFDNVGTTMLLEEDLIDAFTAVAGSGPGYFFELVKNRDKTGWVEYAKNIFMPELIQAAIEVGFSQQQAEILAKATVEGSLALLNQTGLSPETLCSQVSSRGGTTEAGLGVLRITNSLAQAVQSAFNRAKLLAKKE